MHYKVMYSLYGKNLSGHTSLVLRPMCCQYFMTGTFGRTTWDVKCWLLPYIVVDMKQAFEGLHNNIKFVIIGCIQQKLFKGNDQQGECEHTTGGKMD